MVTCQPSINDRLNTENGLYQVCGMRNTACSKNGDKNGGMEDSRYRRMANSVLRNSTHIGVATMIITHGNKLSP